jgi:hypothetical protein
MARGYILLFRKLSKWKYRKNPYALSIWIELLLAATHKTFWSGTWEIKKGQWKGSAQIISNNTGVCYATTKKWLRIFEEEGMIRRYTLPNNQGTIFTILKYPVYQKGKSGKTNNRDERDETEDPANEWPGYSIAGTQDTLEEFSSGEENPGPNGKASGKKAKGESGSEIVETYDPEEYFKQRIETVKKQKQYVQERNKHN